MATVVNNPPNNNQNNWGPLLGFALLAIVVILLFVYALPAIRNATQGPTITIPDQIDIDINQPGQPQLPEQPSE
jgi:hypothetical protein